MTINQLSSAGGIFFILTFVHFVMDWLFQSHHQAMNKHNDWRVRLPHCIVYHLGFFPFMLLFNFSPLEIIFSCLILILSHFFLDTYIVVFWWTKYIRKPPEMNPKYREPSFNEKDAFMNFANTTLGKILVITVDQITHLVFLLPLVWFAVN